MNDPNRAADRVRPFLQAMERSIDAARQRRLNGTPMPSTPAPSPTPTPALAQVPTPAPETHAEPDGDPPRLRARPKRPSYPVFGRDEQQEIRSKAG